MSCEDAPCCGCCGVNIYGIDQSSNEGPPWCDACGQYHRGDCLEDYDELEEEYA